MKKKKSREMMERQRKIQYNKKKACHHWYCLARRNGVCACMYVGYHFLLWNYVHLVYACLRSRGNTYNSHITFVSMLSIKYLCTRHYSFLHIYVYILIVWFGLGSLSLSRHTVIVELCMCVAQPIQPAQMMCSIPKPCICVWLYLIFMSYHLAFCYFYTLLCVLWYVHVWFICICVLPICKMCFSFYLSSIWFFLFHF